MLAKYTEQKEKTEEYGFLLTVLTLISMAENKCLADGTFRISPFYMLL